MRAVIGPSKDAIKSIARPTDIPFLTKNACAVSFEIIADLLNPELGAISLLAAPTPSAAVKALAAAPTPAPTPIAA